MHASKPAARASPYCLRHQWGSTKHHGSSQAPAYGILGGLCYTTHASTSARMGPSVGCQAALVRWAPLKPGRTFLFWAYLLGKVTQRRKAIQAVTYTPLVKASDSLPGQKNRSLLNSFVKASYTLQWGSSQFWVTRQGGGCLNNCSAAPCSQWHTPRILLLCSRVVTMAQIAVVAVT